MPLQKQHFPVIFGEGLDTKTDPKLVKTGKLLIFENGRFNKTGSIFKSKGYTCFPRTIVGSSSTITSGRTLATFKDELLLFSSNNLYSYSSSGEAWLDRGVVGASRVISETVVRNSARQTLQDAAYTRGITLYAWEDSRGGVRATVIDQVSGLPIQSDVSISATGSRPRCSATPNFLYLHWMDASNELKVKRLDPLNPNAFGVTTTVANDCNGTNPNFDIYKHGNNLVFAYNTTTPSIKVGYIKASGEIGGALDGFPAAVTRAEDGSGAVAITSRFEGDADDAIYVFSHNTTNGVKCFIYPLDLTTPTVVTVDPITSVVNQIAAIHTTSTKVRVWYEVDAAQTYNLRIKSDGVNKAGTADSSGTGTGTGVEWQRGLGLASKPFRPGDGNTYLVGVFETTLQPNYFTMLDVSSSRGVAVNSIAQNQAGGKLTRRSSLAGIWMVDSVTGVFSGLVKNKLVSESGTVYTLTGVNSNSLNFDQSVAFQTVELGENLLIAGGLIQNYDGVSVTEHGFNYFPENISNVVTGGAGSIEAGDRQYSVVYEWTDNAGQLHRSAPSIPLEVTNILNDKNTLTIPTLRLTEKKTTLNRAAVSIAVYRTIDAGTVFYRVSSISSPTANSTTADTVTFEDTAADSTIQSNEILYTTGGVLENIQPQSASVLVDYRNRCLVAGGEDKNKISYSRKVLRGEPVNFNDSLFFRVDQGGDKVTALAVLDEKIVIFKNRQTFVQIGDGPTDAGTQDDFQTPQLIAGDVGCPYPQSIVLYPEGLIFKSEKGFYVLTRSLQMTEIGNPVEEFNSLTLTGGKLLASDNEVRWVHSDGKQVFYDYEHGQWGTDTGVTAVGSAVWQNNYVFLKSNGEVCQESSTTFLNAGSAVSTKIRTGWISAEKLQHALRIYRILAILENRSKHLLRVNLYYDYDYAIRETFTFDTAAVLGSNYYGDDVYYGAGTFYGSQDGQYQVEIRPAIQKCQSIMIEIDDLNPTNTDGGGPVITGLYFEVGVKAGVHRVPSTKRLNAI